MYFLKVKTKRKRQQKNSLKCTLKLSVFAFLVVYHLPPFSLPSLFKWRGYKESADATGLKRKRSQGTVTAVLLSVAYAQLQLSWLKAQKYQFLFLNVSVALFAVVFHYLHLYENCIPLRCLNIKMFHFKTTYKQFAEGQFGQIYTFL